MFVARIIGLALVVAGIAGGLYVGVWLCFIGGIVDVITACKADVTIPLDIAIGVAKVLFCGVAGWLCGFLCIIPGAAMLGVRNWK